MVENTQMDSGSNKKIKLNFIFSIVAFIELIVAGLITLTISPSPKNAWLLGFSAQRWALMLVTFFLAAFVFIIGKVLYQKKITFQSILRIKADSFGQRLFLLAVFSLFLWGSCAVFFPSYYFGNWAPYYDRLRPLSITVGLILLQFNLVSIFSDKKISLRIEDKPPFLRAALFFAVCLIALTAFIMITKIGLVKETAYWNVPGIPLTGQQILIVVISICLGMYMFPKADQSDSSRGASRFIRFLPFLVYLVTVLVWGLTPMLKHFFSFQPTPPNYQPFPFSDARVDDLGGISIIKGDGINFHGATDKPLYMVFLSILHLIAGNNYPLLTWLQIFVLGFIPVVLYLFGKKFHGLGFGLYLASITILRQRNAIVLSYKIASVNPQLLITEVMTLLGVVLLAYLVFLWLRTQKLWLALASGGVIGAASLIRMNPFFLFPAIACLVLVAFWKLQKLKWKHLAFFTLGFLILVTPWFITGVNQDGVPWVLDKVIAVVDSRYGSTAQPTEIPTSLPLTQEAPTTNPVESVLPANTPISAQGLAQQLTLSVSPQATPGLNLQPNNTFDKISQVSDLFVNHFLHNFATSVLALPDSLTYNDLADPNELNALSLRPYWLDQNNWQGSLPATQVFFIFLNLVLIAIGLGYSWSHYRWAGLVPLVIFLGYDLSLALAMNSGSRYIVPIDWILYFYYGLSFVCVIRWITNALFGQEQGGAVNSDAVLSSDATDKKRIRQALGILIVVASLIPVANIVIPALFNHPTQSTNIKELSASIPFSQRKGTSIVSGEIYYPYYSPDGVTFGFDLFANQMVNSFSTNFDGRPLKVTLGGGETVLVGLRMEEENPQVRFIYLQTGSSLELIWESDSPN